MHRSTLIRSCALLCLFTAFAVLPAAGAPTTIVDVTAGSATRDGAIGIGEYVGSSMGINNGFGNVIGSSSEIFVDSATDGTVNFGLRSGGGGLFDAAVIYIDTGTGGFASTSGFTDVADGLRRALSGYDGSNRSQIDFGASFRPSYAIGIEAGFSGLWSLVDAGSHGFIRSTDLTPTGDSNAGEWELEFNLSDIGLAPGATFKYVVTYLNSGNAFRSDEFHGVSGGTVPPGNPGQSLVTLGSGDFNTFESVSADVPVSSTLVLVLSGVLLTGAGLWVVRRRHVIASDWS